MTKEGGQASPTWSKMGKSKFEGFVCQNSLGELSKQNKFHKKQTSCLLLRKSHMHILKNYFNQKATSLYISNYDLLTPFIIAKQMYVCSFPLINSWHHSYSISRHKPCIIFLKVDNKVNILIQISVGNIK